MEDTNMLEWLEANMNKRDIFYFRDNAEDENKIDCFFKSDDTKFCTYYRDKVQIMIDTDISIIN